MVLHGQILASQVPKVWRVDVIMQVDALKQKAKPSEVVVTPVQTPQPVSGATPVIMAPPPPAMSLMDKKDAIVSALKTKLLPAAAPPPPAPVAISGAPTSVSGTPIMQSVLSKEPKNMTAVQLPQIDIPVPQKPQIDLPTVPAVPVYQFQVPDIKSEIEDLGQTAVDKVKGLMSQVRSGFITQA
ncbi:hypothetical protein CVIRNUC_009506 [Coccomyxa viridis]|uniref:Uncharacterized protein n=1 Tax=Coccomyxa viridis TaxID=1274662 RepID=A0AAV1IG63_9CHLO|nr:hypothetical protein CVIRNUC_009506 [Coccomyxa viridis]